MSNKKKGKKVKEEKDNKQEEQILKLEIENSEEIDEKEFEKAKRKYEERMKLPFGIKKGIYVKILKELIIPVVMVVLFTLTYILKEVLNFITINVFVLILGTLSIAIYEFSYRKSKEEYFIKGLEVNVLTYIYIIFSNTLMQARLDFKSMLIYALVIFVYYVIKSVIIYGIEKKKYIQKFIDTKDIVKDSRKKYIL
ncbi:MAG: hypothetical protein HXK70_04285 [Clostridiales bacterium]|nr:hypothetical protein [Clostridiales bacterium]